MQLPKSIQTSIYELSKLPSIGPRMAERIVLFILKKKPADILNLSQAIKELAECGFCERCYNFSSDKLCLICQNKKRDQRLICIVEDQLDLLALENKNFYHGIYHILGGTLKIGQRDNSKNLKIEELVRRIEKEKIKEIIIATNPTSEGDITAVFIKDKLKKFKNLKITRIGRGMPTGGDIEYADSDSIQGSFESRKGF
jgi:recombination protein RecR